MSEIWARAKSDFYCLILDDHATWPLRGMWAFGRWIGNDSLSYRRYRDIPAVNPAGDSSGV